MRAAFGTWLVATLCMSAFLATIVACLDVLRYFDAPDFRELSIERGPVAFALVCFVAGHWLARRVPSPRCRSVHRAFGASTSYRFAPQLTATCGDPKACARRALRALHRRIAFGVALSLPIALLAFRAAYTYTGLGSTWCCCCHCSPLYEGGHILLYGAFATLAVLSHLPALAFDKRECHILF